MVKGFLTVQHHFDPGSDSDSFNDPSGCNRASYDHHPCDDFEPLPDVPNGYRTAALAYLKLMWNVDEFIAAAEDARLAVVAVAVTLGWPSARGLSVGNIADQLGCSPSTLTRSIARFKTLAGLDSAGGVRFIPHGAGRAATSRRRFGRVQAERFKIEECNHCTTRDHATFEGLLPGRWAMTLPASETIN